MERFEIEGSPALLFRASEPKRALIFAAGRGGDPARHNPLLAHLAAAGVTVIAPQEAMLPTTPDAAMLGARIERLAVAGRLLPDLPLIGLGHSIGGTCLMALAGAKAWTMAREEVPVTVPLPFHHLIALAPPTGFFRAPGALDAFTTPLTLRMGSADNVTPPAQAQFLAEALPEQAQLITDPGAGHFTYMDSPPPGPPEPHPDAPAFRAKLAEEIAALALA